jgi:hypothetical protein
VEIHSETAVIKSRMMMPMAPDRAMVPPLPAATLRDLIGVDLCGPASRPCVVPRQACASF